MKNGDLNRPARQPKVVRAWALVFLLVSAVLSQPPAPAWVKKIPLSEDQYVGIGKVDKRSHPEDYRELAHSSALAQISRSISAQVKTETAASQVEDGSGMRESFSQKIKVGSANHLTGYQTAGDFETEEEYWVLVTLEKSAHEKFLNGKADELILRSKGGIVDLQGDLHNRRFQEAMDRTAEMKREHTAFLTAHPVQADRGAQLDSLHQLARSLLRDAARHPLEMSLDFEAEGSGIPETAIRQLRGDLYRLHAPFYRVTREFRGGPTLKVRLLGIERDTLEGMTFTAVRGEAHWPGEPMPKAVRGKSGHPDRERSLSLALRDFVKDLEKFHP